MLLIFGLTPTADAPTHDHNNDIMLVHDHNTLYTNWSHDNFISQNIGILVNIVIA